MSASVAHRPPAGLERPAHRALDLTLGGDTHLLEELAHFDVECAIEPD